jgi:4a-hydroxytetrahydrobiopterin dehydratase
MTTLAQRRCESCAPGTPALTAHEQEQLAKQISSWSNIDGKRIQCEFRFKTYMDGVLWVHQVAEAADVNDHHPDIQILYRKVRIELWTHTVDGLSENDYILAAKIDALYQNYAGKK